MIEASFRRPTAVEGTDLTITLVEPDDADGVYDAAIVIRTPSCTVFDNNDCTLGAEKLRWIRGHAAIDYAFLGYSPASPFPICFEMPADEKVRLLRESAERAYAGFVDTARALGPRLAVPFASGLRFLHAGTTWRNAAFNSAAEAVRRGRAAGLAAAALGPGDAIDADGTIRRHAAVLERDAELAAIDAHARDARSSIASAPRLPPARADLVDRFRDYVLAAWRARRAELPGVRGSIVSFALRGGGDERVHFDFTGSDDTIFRRGDAARYDMRYTYAAARLQHTLDGGMDWDELDFAADTSIAQRRHARDFQRLLRVTAAANSERAGAPDARATRTG